MKMILTYLLLLSSLSLASQTTIKGKLIDKISKDPISHGTIILYQNGQPIKGVMSNDKGYYELIISDSIKCFELLVYENEFQKDSISFNNTDELKTIDFKLKPKFYKPLIDLQEILIIDVAEAKTTNNAGIQPFTLYLNSQLELLNDNFLNHLK